MSPRAEDNGRDAGNATLDRANRTFICAVLFVDIVDYSKKPVSQQLRIKERFNACLSEALEQIAANDRIILDTGDGAAINFLGDLEDALFVAIGLAQLFEQPAEDGSTIAVRIGINLGPVQLMRDINGQLNIIGDGINVAERVMSFAQAGQVLVSRWYFEAVTRVSEDYTHLFTYQGSRTDKHVREHEIYAVASAHADALDVAARRQRARPSAPPDLKLVQSGTQSAPARERSIWRQKLPHIAAALSCLVLVAAIVTYYVHDRAANSTAEAIKFSPQIRLAEPTKTPAEPTKTAADPTRSAAETAPPEHPAGEPTKLTNPFEKRATAPASSASKKTATRKVPVIEVTPMAAAPKSSEPGAATPSVSPWGGGYAKASAPPQDSHAAAATSPYTGAAGKGATALVMLAVSPWGEVVVDGKPAGVTPPLAELELTAGTHHLEIRNGDFAPHQVTLQLEANQTIKIKHKFTQR